MLGQVRKTGLHKQAVRRGFFSEALRILFSQVHPPSGLQKRHAGLLKPSVAPYDSFSSLRPTRDPICHGCPLAPPQHYFALGDRGVGLRPCRAELRARYWMSSLKAQGGRSPALGGRLCHGSGCLASARPASKAARICVGSKARGSLPISTPSGIPTILNA